MSDESNLDLRGRKRSVHGLHCDGGGDFLVRDGMGRGAVCSVQFATSNLGREEKLRQFSGGAAAESREDTLECRGLHWPCSVQHGNRGSLDILDAKERGGGGVVVKARRAHTLLPSGSGNTIWEHGSILVSATCMVDEWKAAGGMDGWIAVERLLEMDFWNDCWVDRYIGRMDGWLSG